MGRKYFGTDGVRGPANSFPMTADIALKLGAAAGRYFQKSKNLSKRVVIGKDTRLSGYMFENALTAGLTSTGMNVLLLGPVPTPAVGLLTPSMRADLGIMISASHNGFEDNGIKFFGPDGYKLSDEVENQIETLLDEGANSLAPADQIGCAQRIDDGLFRYVERAKSSFPSDVRLDGMKVVIDCANGAGYKAAPEVLWELGANVIPVAVNPNGRNINHNCGSTKPQLAAETVVAHGADLGICLDGDADRVILIDEKGRVADGDQLMGLLAQRWASEDRLQGNALVATVMSNLGLEQFLQGHKIDLLRTNVGDRYVVEKMRQGGFNLGGEQSGHIIMTEHATTGDGLMAALQFLGEMKRSDTSASDLANVFEPVPQLLKNIRFVAGDRPLEAEPVQKTIAAMETKLAGQGRLLIRKSGTEPLIRVMAECTEPALLEQVVDEVVGAVEAVCQA
ncbi:MAG: phosphoglucosamine mutase [Rhodobacteraceae bacterium]|nr:phosphoglucosamine mutase [Paracoccaceae bacterium]MBL6676653.1 phosphoglucosamine mutase [Paracoccaceae bacterium]MBL6788551.1 phosphoglucosamine mutase [Paracoccaceae bacterium]MBL6859100.1 phosphoglucosamine mutase [Paracoccaceae bacterium]